MTKLEKLLEKIRQGNTFRWSELVTLLGRLGYKKTERAGSRVSFFNAKTEHFIKLHNPHPGNEIKGGALKSVREALIQEGYL